MEGRDTKGRFVKGNTIGNGNHSSPGRPKKAREERYYQITQSSCTFADWGKIVKKAVSQAIRGDSAARKFLADYLLGPPPKELRITGADGGVFRAIFGWDKDENPDDSASLASQ